jgi:hypothetical protein
MKKIADRYLPFPRILHPWPERGSSSPSKVGALCVSSTPAAHAPRSFMAYGHELLLDLSELGTHSLADWPPPEHEARRFDGSRNNARGEEGRAHVRWPLS